MTGCAGFIGSHLAERLVANGTRVVGVDCFTAFYPRLMKERNLEALLDDPRFHLLGLDLSCDPLEGLLEGVDTVFHLAAQAGVRGSFKGFEDYVKNNLQSTQRLLEEAVDDPVEAFVYASSSSVYGDAEAFPTSEAVQCRPVSPYGVTKRGTEEIADVYHRAHGVPAVGLRYFTAYGPRQRPDMAFSRFISAARAGGPITIFGDGRQVRDFTYVDDVVEGTLSAVSSGRRGGVYNIGGGSPTELINVIPILEELLDRPIDLDHLPRARGDARHTGADGSLARSELGFEPEVTLAEGLQRQVGWALESQKVLRI